MTDLDHNLSQRTSVSNSDAGAALRNKLAPNNPLLLCCREWGVREDASCTLDFLYDTRTDHLPFCWAKLIAKARVMLEQRKEAPEQKFDACADVWVSPNHMEAWLMVYPPLNGGDDATLDLIKKSLAEQNVNTNIDEDVISDIAENKAYLLLAKIAEGTPPVHGEDWQLEDFSEQYRFPEGQKSESEKVNFKELHQILNVKKGQELCEVIPPTPGENGVDVCGKKVPAKPGKPAPFLAGKNTVYSDDRRFVLANIDGQLLRTRNQYTVSEVLTINGNINYETGNIHANGTVVVYGNVCSNFIIEAKQDIIIHGTVEGGTLIAGKDIYVHGGVVANNHSELRAGNDIHCKFMEYGVAHAKGSAYFESLIQSEVHCEGDVDVSSGRGAMIGGKIFAMGKISIGMLGSRAYCSTEVTIGLTKELFEQKNFLIEKISTAEVKIKEADDNIAKLQELTFDERAQEMIKQLEASKNIPKLKLQNYREQLAAIAEKEEASHKSMVYVEHAFPNVVIKISDSALKLQQEAKHSVFCVRDDVITCLPKYR